MVRQIPGSLGGPNAPPASPEFRPLDRPGAHMNDFIEVYTEALDAGTCRRLVERFDASGQAERGHVGSGVDTSLKDSYDILISGRPEWQEAEALLVRAAAEGVKQYIRKYPFALIGALSLRLPDPLTGQVVAINERNFAQLSGCPKITSADRATLMWANRVIPFGHDFATHEANRRLLRAADFLSFVFPDVQTSAAMKSCVRARCPNVFQDRFVTPQRFASPVRADQAEHAMVNGIPLRRSGRKVRHGDRQTKFVRESLQRKLPFPLAMVVCPSAVHFDQQSMPPLIAPTTNIQPPAPDGRDFKARCFLRDADHHVAIVVSQIVDSCGVGAAHGPAWVIVIQHLMRPTPPGAAWILEIPHQLLFLGIHGNYGQISIHIPVPQPDQVTELPIAISVANARFLLATSSQREAQTPQQASERCGRQPHSPTTQGLAEFSQRAMGPFHASGRIASRGILQKLLQGRQSPGRFSSKCLRPAPVPRIRPAGKRRFSRNSLWPCAIVLRCSPVTRAMSWMPPRPIFDASKPARSLRIRSSATASKRLIARCSPTTAPRRCSWQMAHSQE